MHRRGEKRESETKGVETYRKIQERDASNAVTLRGRRCRLKNKVNRKRPPPQEEHRSGKAGDIRLDNTFVCNADKQERGGEADYIAAAVLE